MKTIPFFLSLLLIAACNPPVEQTSEIFDPEQVEAEARATLTAYHEAMAREGLRGEFGYLDDSEDFFWVPPGYQSAISYDSVRTILLSAADHFAQLQHEWEELRVLPLSPELVNYSGIVRGEMLDTAGHTTHIRLIETGLLIKRASGWKMLSGQSAELTKADDPFIQ